MFDLNERLTYELRLDGTVLVVLIPALCLPEGGVMAGLKETASEKETVRGDQAGLSSRTWF